MPFPKTFFSSCILSFLVYLCSSYLRTYLLTLHLSMHSPSPFSFAIILILFLLLSGFFLFLLMHYLFHESSHRSSFAFYYWPPIYIINFILFASLSLSTLFFLLPFLSSSSPILLLPFLPPPPFLLHPYLPPNPPFSFSSSSLAYTFTQSPYLSDGK